MNNSVITDGRRGYTLAVDSDGRAAANVSGATGKAKVVRSDATGGTVLDTSSSELVPTRPGRQSLCLYNDGPNEVRINFDDDATSTDFALAVGEKYTFDTVGEEAVNAIAIGGTSTVKVIEWVSA